MMRPLALVSSIAVLGAVGFVPKAGAQAVPQDMDFGGNVRGICVFTNTIPGTLAAAGLNNPWVEASGPNAGSPGFNNRGQVGLTTVNCTSGGQLTVDVPIRLAAPAGFNDSARQAVVVVQGSTLATSASTGGTFPSLPPRGTTPITIGANTPTVLVVGMAAGENNGTGGVPTGTYLYRVVITATPN